MLALISSADAAREILARRAARSDFLAFTQYTHPQYRAAPHHRLIASKLEAVERGDVTRLAIFMPPRHGKSELASRRFPAWFLGRNPSLDVISASYNSDLASDFGRDVRDIARDPLFRNVFSQFSLRADSQAADRWKTNDGGAYRSAGVGTAMTGRGADLLIIDDPLKDRQSADSELTRRRIWEWYTSTAYTRLMPGGRIVVIQTRWHDDDLAGRLLEGDEGWDVLELPAIGPDGAALWSDQYDISALTNIRNTIGPRDWSALYQQKPQADEGEFFKREWFKRWSVLPDVRKYLTADFAVTADAGDYTVIRCWGVSSSGDVYLIDGYRGQSTSDVWIERLCDLVIKHRPLCFFGEGGVIQKAIEPMLIRRMRERKAFCRLEWMPSINDKPTRARGFQARASMGKVLISSMPEYDAVIDEFTRFPAGKHDDDVDCGSLLGRALDMVHPALGAGEQEKTRTKPDYGYTSARSSKVESWTTM